MLGIGSIVGVLSAVLVRPIIRAYASVRGATYRSEAELTDEVATRVPDTRELQAIENVDIQVRSKASRPWPSEFFSREVLASLTVELVDDAPRYDIAPLQKRLNESQIPVVQLFSRRLVKKGDLGMNELLLTTHRTDSKFEVLVELGGDIGKIEQWIRDLDAELLDHLRSLDDGSSEGFDIEQYEHGERIGTSITAHLSRTSREESLDRLLTRAETRVQDVTVFRRREPDWYLERVGGSDRLDDTVLSVSHRVRVDSYRSGTIPEREEFQDSEKALTWLRDFIEDPPETFDTPDRF
ncbi:hypothetical protein [Halosimplex halobium]|uniref:hypothetical protein n=1 Tax=Halosimplex halobium TaxID=3396618 RepID=UPI003F5529EF